MDQDTRTPRKCPQCGMDQTGDQECQICGFIFHEETQVPLAKSRTPWFLPVNLTILVILCVAAVVLYRYQHTPVPVSPAGGIAGKIAWETDYDRGMAGARATRTPVMLFFTADWCGYCRELIRDAFSDGDLARAAEQVVPILVDIDAHKSLARDYKIQGVPTVIFLDRDGKQTDAYSGARDAGLYIKVINRLAGD